MCESSLKGIKDGHKWTLCSNEQNVLLASIQCIENSLLPDTVVAPKAFGKSNSAKYERTYFKEKERSI